MTEPFLVFDCSALTDVIVVECIAEGRTRSRGEVLFSSEHSQQLMTGVNEVTQASGCMLQQIRGIVFIHGAERFTVARLGVVTVNALAWTLRVPLCEFLQRPHTEEMIQKLQSTSVAVPIVPRYSKEPNVTV
jgi:tRNA A37 threonylcarbamoyladenosine modification protein TsaB